MKISTNGRIETLRIDSGARENRLPARSMLEDPRRLQEPLHDQPRDLVGQPRDAHYRAIARAPKPPPVTLRSE
jgi:hypothetical protein